MQAANGIPQKYPVPNERKMDPRKGRGDERQELRGGEPGFVGA